MLLEILEVVPVDELVTATDDGADDEATGTELLDVPYTTSIH